MKKIILAFLALAIFLSNATAAFAQGVTGAEWKNRTEKDWGEAVAGASYNSETAAKFSLEDTFLGFAAMTTGSPFIIAYRDDPEKMYAYFQGSAVGKMNGAIAAMYEHKPADFGLWLAHTGRSLGFLPNKVEAQGQGIGFTGLEPLLPIWQAFRNIAYLLMAVVMIIIGFLVMFRKKIDPKTVVTAQNAIPRVIIALILITFSYAIVGFMIDIMYLLLFFFIALFKSAGLQLPNAALFGIKQIDLNPFFGINNVEQLYGAGGLFINMENIEINPWKIVFGAQSIVGALNNPVFVNSSIIVTVAGVIAILAGAVPIGVGVIGIGALSMPILHFIISIALLFLFIRLLAFFLSTYIQIIVSLLIAPLQLLAEAVPGSNAFSSWFKNLIANLSVFPIAGSMFMLSAMFTQFSNEPSINIWRPPYTAIGGNNVAIASLVSLGILFAIPAVAGSIKEALKAKPAIGLSGPAVGGALSTASQITSLWYYIKMIRGEKELPGLIGLKTKQHEEG